EVPSSAPAATAARNSGNWLGRYPTEETFPASAAIEFKRMKAATTPDVRRGSSHALRMISGLRKMPPPVPVKPASRPSTAPAGRLIQYGGALVSRSASALGCHSSLSAAAHRRSPTSGL